MRIPYNGFVKEYETLNRPEMIYEGEAWTLHTGIKHINNGN